MRISVRSCSTLYFLLIFIITSYFIADYTQSFIFDPPGISPTIVFGQLGADDNGKQGLNPKTTINAAIDGNNNAIANNGSTTSNTMKFSFSGTDGKGTDIHRFECSMDGKPFVTCVSINTVNVGLGTHTFSVRSEDNTGNKDTSPASFTWTVNSETSNTQIDFATDGNKATIVNGSNTSSSSATFAFSGTDNHGAVIYRFECSMDAGVFSSCVSTNTVNVGDGTHTFRVRSEDNAGNKDSTPASITWTVDTTSPKTSIISALDGSNNTISDNGKSESTSIRFNFSGTDTGGAGINNLQCNIDNSKYVACTSPFVFPNLLKDGVHTFTVMSEDKAGNKDETPASFTWTVDTTPPKASIISAIDDSNNTVSNNGKSESSSISFTFSGTDIGGVGLDHFECKIDNSKYVACTSPFILSNVLKDGIHTFNVRSTDRVGNINISPASLTWTVDTISPNTVLEAATDGNKILLSNRTNTNSNSISFEFSATDSGGDGNKGVGINHFSCNIDNSKYVACTSPFAFPSVIKDGAHTFTVVSEDNAGNKDLTPASFNWIVDTSPPLIFINESKDGNGNLLSNGSNTSSNSATISFTGNDTGGKNGQGVGVKEFKCSLDGASFSNCTSPVQFTSINLPEGTHNFQIIAEDRLGNINSSPRSFNWTVDTEPPEIAVDSAIDGHQKRVTSGDNSSSNSLIFEFTSVDIGGREGKGVGTKQVECKIDNSDFVLCTSPVEFTNLGNGIHTLHLRAEDNVGNISPSPESFRWTIDTVAPTTSINKAIVGDEISLTNGSNSKFNSITFTFTGNDTGGLGIRGFECSLDNSNFTACTSPVQYNRTIITDGPHDFKVFSKDNVGNNDLTPAKFTWNVDTIAPIVNITKIVDGNILAITNNSNTKSNSAIFEFSGNDTGGVGVDHIECSLDGASFTTCTSPVQFSSAEILDGTHAFSVRAQDKVGNIMSTPLLFNWTVDTMAPSTKINTAIDGNNKTLVSDGSTRSTSTTFAFTGNDVGTSGENGVGVKQFECKVDNSNYSVCTSPAHYDNMTDGNHTLAVISEDKVGNVGSTPSLFNWTVDTKPPSASIYSATDGNSNFLLPGSNTSSNSISFEFSANDSGGREDKGVGIKQFECSLDDSNFTTCSSPVEFASDNLDDGNHTFKIEAEDNVGNVNPSPASFSWNVDTAAPTTIIKHAMDGNRSTITNGSNTRSSFVIFEFAGNDTGTGINHFECSIDNSNFTSCTSPVQSNKLAEGYHSVKIRSQDGVGNTDDSPASFGWTVDTVAPLTTINSVIDGNSSEILNGGNTSSNTVRVEFSGTDSGVGINHFECNLDNSEFTTCTSPLYIKNLTDGVHVLETRAHDNVGNKDVSSASFSWTVDSVPPTTPIISVSNGNNSSISNKGNTSSNSATFSFSAIDKGGIENKGVGISSFDCSIDNSNFITCVSPMELNSLREGIHTLKIYSKDNVGKTSFPASFSWSVDTIAPFSTINSATDGNNRTLKNNDNSSSTSIKLTFTGNDSGGVGIAQLECSLDGGTFVSCASPIQYSSENISDGAHVLEVRAKDRAGNTSPPSSFTWTVDTVPPDANIDSAIDGHNTIVSTGGNTSSNSMLFNFSGVDIGGKEGSGVGINHFECSLDNSNFSACIGPVRASNLEDGAHILEVRAEDNVGNTSPSPSSFTWTVDTTPPTTTINSAIDGLQKSITNGGNSNSMSMRLGFTGNDTGVGVNHFECRLDDSNFTSCTSPMQSGNLTDGDHVFEVRAGDNVRNVGVSPASFRWTVDTTPPATLIESATDGHGKEVVMDGNSSSNSILLKFAGADNGTGINHLECSINNSDFLSCTSPLEINGLTDGVHTFRVISEDNSTNKDPSAALVRWTVDTKSPLTSIDSAVDINQTSIANGESTKSTSMTFEFSGTDTGGVQIDHFECSIDNSDFVTCTTPVQFSNLKDGAHILQLKAEDNVGNVGTSSSYTWTVDTTAPATSINSATDGNKSAVTNDGTTRSTSMTFTFSGTDTGGVDHFECSLDNSNFTICVSPILFNSVNLKDGLHTFEVLSEDNSTNKDQSPASFTWTVDTQPPSTTITSATDGNRTELGPGGNTSSNSMTFGFSANDTGGQEDKGVGINHFECNIDNSKFVTCTSPFTFQKLLNDGNHTFNVISVDNSRNKDPSPSTFSWSVDTTPPDTSIKTAIDGNKSAVSNGGTTKSTSMTFTFSGNDTGGVGVDHFECNVDGLNFVACSSPFTFPSLSEDGQYTLEIRAHDRVGNKDASPASFTWTVDTIPPETSIDSATDGNNKVISAGENTSSNSMIFLFSSNDGGVGVDHSECSIDDSDYTLCTSPIQFTSSKLGDGTHTLQVKSEDKVGNRGSSPASFNWTIDTVPSTAKIDSAVDGNKSAVANDGSTKSTSMTFTFSGNDTGGVGVDHFECSIDNSEFTTCTSPFTFPELLKDGQHTFRVLSEDKVGNRGSSPDSFSWMVDTVSPSTTIDSVMDGNNDSIDTSGNSSSSSVTIRFSGIDTGGDQDKGVGINHFECSLDGATFANCNTPLKLDKLADGSHTIEIRSSDNVGNDDESPASFIWAIDTVPPTTSFTSAVDGNRNSVVAGGNTSSRDMTFTFSGTDSGTGLSLFECSLDGAAFSTCDSPIELNNLSDGSHTFSIRSKDNVANQDQSPATFTWIIDTSPPTTSIDSAVDGKKVSLSNSSSTQSNSITFTFSGNDTGKSEVKRFECSTDNSDFVTCTSPFGFPNLLSDGSHTFKVRAEDNSGNKDASPEVFGWSVDTTPPPANINSVFDGNNDTVSNGGNTTSTSMIFTLSATDIGAGLDHFECSIDGASFTTCTSPVQFNDLSDGSHTLEVRAADKVGNEGPTPTAFIWTVNTKPPNTSINSVIDGNKNVVTNNSNTRSNTITILFSASEVVSNVDHFECSIDNSEFTTCSSPFTFPNLLADGPHTFKARAEDNSGHADMSPALYTWTVDTGAPTASISSATDNNRKEIPNGGGTQSTSMIFTFTGTDKGVGISKFECSIDGATFVACTSPAQFDNLGSGVHILNVKAVDNVGNEAISPTKFSWSVDATPPDTTIETAIDGNGIAVSNDGNTTSASMTFTFSGSDIGVGLDHFECSLDGSTFSTCASPLQVNSLSLGAHTMEIRAEDKIRNEGETPTVFLWTITSPPATPPPAHTPIPQNITSPPATPPPAQIPIPQNLTTPPQITPSIGGNQSTKSNLTAETSGPVQQPDTRIISAVDGSGTAIATDGVTSSNSIFFILSSSTGDIQKGTAFNNFECSIDGSAFTSCTSPAQFSNLADGAHILEARSTDNSGNADKSPASFTWTVDTVPPDTIISSANDGNNNTITNGSNTESTSVELIVAGSDTSIEEDEEVGIHFECSLDGSSYSTCTSPVQYDNLGVGNHVVKIIAQDNSGNKDLSPASFIWNVKPVQQGTNTNNNTTTPMSTNIGDTIINSITDGGNNAIANESKTPSSTIRFEFSSMNVANLDHFECSMDGSDFVTCTSPFIFPILPEGKHAFMVRFVDLDGNMDQTPATFVWDITG